MKTTIKLSVILSLFITVLIINAKPQHTTADQLEPSTQSITADTTHTEPSNTTQTYTITHVTGEDYYGISDSADDSVYFTDEYLQSTGTTKKGDTVQVTYDAQGELLFVDRITSAQPEPTMVSTNSPDQSSQLTSESYTVTKVTDNPTNNDEYYAEKSNGTGVSFNSDFIQSIGKISIGDTVNVFYDGEDLAYVSAN